MLPPIARRAARMENGSGRGVHLVRVISIHRFFGAFAIVVAVGHERHAEPVVAKERGHPFDLVVLSGLQCLEVRARGTAGP